MNMKRAFLAAVAVFIMMPGLAMAQSSSTFPGSFTFVPLGPDGAEFELSLTCNGGTPLSQSVMTAADNTINFTVIGAFEAGAVCNFGISGLPANGWDLTDNGNCDDVAAVENGSAAECVYAIEPTPFSFWADISWMANSETASDVPVSGDLTLTCSSVWDTVSMVTTVSDTYPISMDGLQILAGDYAPHPDGSTVCSATLMVDDSAVEVDNSGCSAVSVEVGDPVFVSFEDLPRGGAEEVSICNIEASVFFEGIPTLSQYGMAIMVLLMLGVGFVGFRRFV
jgi:hypothetical protein